MYMYDWDLEEGEKQYVCLVGGSGDTAKLDIRC